MDLNEISGSRIFLGRVIQIKQDFSTVINILGTIGTSEDEVYYVAYPIFPHSREVLVGDIIVVIQPQNIITDTLYYLPLTLNRFIGIKHGKALIDISNGENMLIGAEKLIKEHSTTLDIDNVDTIMNNDTTTWNSTKTIDVTTDKTTWKSDTSIDVTTTTKTVNASGGTTWTTPTFTLNGNLVVNGTIDATEVITSSSDCISGGVSGKTHIHIGNLGAPTSPPI